MGEKVFRRKPKPPIPPKKYHFVLTIYSMDAQRWSCVTGTVESTKRRNEVFNEALIKACDVAMFAEDDGSILIHHWSLEPNEL
jgi:hypothetical protein